MYSMFPHHYFNIVPYQKCSERRFPSFLLRCVCMRVRVHLFFWLPGVYCRKDSHYRCTMESNCCYTVIQFQHIHASVNQQGLSGENRDIKAFYHESPYVETTPLKQHISICILETLLVEEKYFPPSCFLQQSSRQIRTVVRMILFNFVKYNICMLLPYMYGLMHHLYFPFLSVRAILRSNQFFRITVSV